MTTKPIKEKPAASDLSAAPCSEQASEYLQIAAQQEIATAAKALKSAESLLKDAGMPTKGARARLRFWRNSLRGEVRSLESSIPNK